MERLRKNGLTPGEYCAASAVLIYAWMYPERTFTVERLCRYRSAMGRMRRTGGSSSGSAAR